MDSAVTRPEIALMWTVSWTKDLWEAYQTHQKKSSHVNFTIKAVWQLILDEIWQKIRDISISICAASWTQKEDSSQHRRLPQNTTLRAGTIKGYGFSNWTGDNPIQQKLISACWRSNCLASPWDPMSIKVKAKCLMSNCLAHKEDLASSNAHALPACLLRPWSWNKRGRDYQVRARPVNKKSVKSSWSSQTSYSKPE